MSDEAKDKEKKPEAPKASGKGKWVAVGVIALVLVGASSAAGAVVAPMLQKPTSAAKADKKPGEEEEDDEETKEPPTLETLPLDSIVIDVRSDQGEVHHLKIGIALEIKVKVGEEELKGFVPRARDAAITYLRSLSPTDVTSSQRFEPMRKELQDRIIKAVGKKFVKKILITDFVVQ